LSGLLETGGVVIHHSQSAVAVGAEYATYRTGLVVMVNTEAGGSLVWIGEPLTDGTAATLMFEQGPIGFGSETILSERDAFLVWPVALFAVVAETTGSTVVP
jgi:hypothetical protein